MIWLPELAERGALPRLPLSLAAGPALVSLLAGGQGADAQETARCALETDPALALWTLLRAWRAGDDKPRTVESLAQWLHNHAAQVLQWPAAPEPAPDDAEWGDAYHRLARASVAIARRAREMAAAGSSCDAAEAYLLGLLHCAPRWLVLDPAYAARAAANAEVPGPAWFTAALEQLRPPAGPPAVDAVACVADALESYKGAEDEHPRDDSAALAALSRGLPALAARLAAGERLERDFDTLLTSAKLAAVAEFAAGAGHEINNPIAVIAGRAQLLIDGEVLAERRRELAVINTQAMRVYEMIADMMLFARPPVPRMAACDLSQVVDRVLSELVAAAKDKTVSLERASRPDVLLVSVDENQVATALKAICQNALEAVDKGGRVAVSLQRTELGSVSIRVTDDGVGLSTETLEHLFDPFYCGRAAGRRLGMGLAKAWRIVRNHGGQIFAENRVPRGAAITIALPGRLVDVQPPLSDNS